jgi:hypothetical protein
MDLRTLRFYKNGVDEGVAFTDLVGEVFPIVCTYRANIEVALLRTEFTSNSSGAAYGANFSSKVMSLTTGGVSNAGTVVDDGASVLHSEKTCDSQWCTAINKYGWRNGVHCWDVSLRCGDSTSFVAAGIVGAPASASDRALVDRKFLESRYWGAVEGEGGVSSTSHVGQSASGLSYALKGDGSLWSNGKKVAVNYGGKVLTSLKPDAVITVCLNLEERSLSFSVNGESLGEAFGANGKGGDMTVDDWCFFPAVSLKKYGDYISMRPAGAGGTTVSLDWLLDVERSLSFLGGQLSASLISGPSISVEEEEYEDWLRSPIVIGGLDSNEDLIDDFLYEVAAETSTGLCLMIGADADGGLEGGLASPPRSPGNKGRGRALPFVSKTPLSDTLGNITRNQIEEWDKGANLSTGPLSPTAVLNIQPPDPDLVIRDRILDEIALATAPRSKMGEKFHDWMELLVGEPAFIKKHLTAKGAYDFPFVEQPFVAALLKHTGLWREVMFLISESSEVGKGRLASTGMRELWGKVKTLRGFLRRKRQL